MNVFLIIYFFKPAAKCKSESRTKDSVLLKDSDLSKRQKNTFLVWESQFYSIISEIHNF